MSAKILFLIALLAPIVIIGVGIATSRKNATSPIRGRNSRVRIPRPKDRRVTEVTGMTEDFRSGTSRNWRLPPAMAAYGSKADSGKPPP